VTWAGYQAGSISTAEGRYSIEKLKKLLNKHKYPPKSGMRRETR
jgi:hypothetical protein